MDMFKQDFNSLWSTLKNHFMDTMKIRGIAQSSALGREHKAVIVAKRLLSEGDGILTRDISQAFFCLISVI
jgi:hypothetical protein